VLQLQKRHADDGEAQPYGHLGKQRVLRAMQWDFAHDLGPSDTMTITSYWRGLQRTKRIEANTIHHTLFTASGGVLDAFARRLGKQRAESRLGLPTGFVQIEPDGALRERCIASLLYYVSEMLQRQATSLETGDVTLTLEGIEQLTGYKRVIYPATEIETYREY
jgi:hypothetical protein